MGPGTSIYDSGRTGIEPARVLPFSRRSNVPKDRAFLNAMATIARDIRGPLANLSILTELMQAHANLEALDRLSRSTREAQQNAEALCALIDGFLERTRETGDPFAFKPGLVDLADIVRHAVALNEPVAESRHVDLRTTDLVTVVIPGDARLLSEAVEAMIADAIKRSRAGDAVSCSVAYRGPQAVVSINVTGNAMSRRDLDRAMRPFASSTECDRCQPTAFGFGLWIVRLIAERHGGRVIPTARGVRGGTQFDLVLPAGLT